MVKTIKLTEADTSMLSLALGYATGAASREGHNDLRDGFIELFDKVTVQLNPNGYPYGHKNREQVLAKLAEEGVVL